MFDKMLFKTNFIHFYIVKYPIELNAWFQSYIFQNIRKFSNDDARANIRRVSRTQMLNFFRET